MPAVIDHFVAPVCYEQIEILYQDEFILLVNKPSGLLSLSGKNPLNKDSVHFRLVQQFPTATLLHRLDFGTSGVMLLALNKSANANLTRQFQARTVKKTYMAMLDGHLQSDCGDIDAPIAKDKPNFPSLKICYDSGKQALSHYQVLERLENPLCSRVIFTPETGRTHQLRLHSREIGHPILGCDLYGSERTQALASRLLLHAVSLEFDHPVSAKRMLLSCDCPF
ncbi:MAG: RluA family pseudouridine synthase [Xanthomonadales bacterium]|nr:RluA family pseudouridine synthase [Xanthomonadales bacterium]